MQYSKLSPRMRALALPLTTSICCAQKYSKHFEAEKIGLTELVHLNEDRLLKLGLPMGPRIRILQEAKNLQAVLQNGKAPTTTGGKPHSSGLPDSYNLYAVV